MDTPTFTPLEAAVLELALALPAEALAAPEEAPPLPQAARERVIIAARARDKSFFFIIFAPFPNL